MRPLRVVSIVAAIFVAALACSAIAIGVWIKMQAIPRPPGVDARSWVTFNLAPFEVAAFLVFGSHRFLSAWRLAEVPQRYAFDFKSRERDRFGVFLGGCILVAIAGGLFWLFLSDLKRYQLCPFGHITSHCS